MRYVEHIRVRYNECDMQNVVFNGNYWTYADDAVAQWVRAALAVETGSVETHIDLATVGFDFMLKTATGTWHRGARYGDVIDAACSISRWGNTSFDVAVEMSVKAEPVFDCSITYVAVTPGTAIPTTVPAPVRSALDRPF